MRPVRKKKDVCNIYENPIPYVLIINPELGPSGWSKYVNRHVKDQLINRHVKDQ